LAWRLKKAVGIAMVEISKGGFGVSGSHGEGVLFAKCQKKWSAPLAFGMGGGSVGFQIGFEVKRYIFVLMSPKAFKTFTSEEEVALDAKASATGGPEHVAEAASTLPDGEIYVYTSSDGAYAGAAIGGQLISIDGDLNREVYGDAVSLEDVMTCKIDRPKYAKEIYELLLAGEKPLK
jgi:lipid-binding SYLF domain-containing protein